MPQSMTSPAARPISAGLQHPGLAGGDGDRVLRVAVAAPPAVRQQLAASPGRPRLLGEWRFSGRDSELDVLGEETQIRSVTFLSGSTGVGKSAVLREFLARSERQGRPVLRLSGRQPNPARPFAPLSPLLPAGLEASSGREHLEQARRNLLSGAARRRLLLAVDDAHRLDAPSAEFLSTLAGEDSIALLFVLAADSPPPEPLVHLIGAYPVGWLRLEPLPPAALADVLMTALGAPCDRATAAALQAASEGNLSACRELVHRGLEDGRLALSEGLYRWRGSFAPTGALAALVDARLAALPTAVRDQLELLVTAEQVDLGLAVALVGTAALAELERRGMVRLVADGRRQGLCSADPALAGRLRALLPPLRARAHLRRLAELGAGSPSRRAGDDARVVRWLLDAGEAVPAPRAMTAARVQWALRHYGEALALAQAAEAAGEGPASVLLQGEALHALGRFRGAEACYRRAFTLVLSPHEHRLATRLRAWNLCRGLLRPDAALSLIATVAADHPTPADRLELDCLRASALLKRAAPAAALDLVHGLLSFPEGDPNAPLPGLPVCVAASAELGRLKQAGTEADRFLPLLLGQRPPDPWLVTELEFGRWQALVWLDQLDAADQLAERHWDACSRPDELARQHLWSVARGLGQLRRGQARQALRWLREALGPDRLVPPAQLSLCLAGATQACALLGDAAGAQQLTLACRRLGAVAPGDRPSVDLQFCEAWLAVSQGEIAVARDRFQQLARVARANGQRMVEVEALDALVRLGHGRQVGRQVELAAGQVEGEAAARQGRRAKALLNGDPDSLSQLAGEYAAAGLLRAATETSCLAAEVYRRHGYPDAAQRETARAEGVAAACEGTATFSLLGLSRSATSLTPRQRKIALLAAAGASSPQIAKELVLSTRTVESHLYNCFAKLGVRSRQELAAVLTGSAPY